MIGFFIGVALGGLMAGAAVMHIGGTLRRADDEIEPWSAAAYEPRMEQPRARTRLKMNDIEWEIN